MLSFYIDSGSRGQRREREMRLEGDRANSLGHRLGRSAARRDKHDMPHAVHDESRGGVRVAERIVLNELTHETADYVHRVPYAHARPCLLGEDHSGHARCRCRCRW